MIPEFDMSNEKKISIDETVAELKKVDLPIFIWGYAVTADVTFDNLKKLGLNVSGFVSDRKDVNKTAVHKHDVLQKEDLIEKYPEYILIRGFAAAFETSEEKIISMWSGCKRVVSFPDIYDGTFTEEISKEFYLDNKSAFDEVYDDLADEFSKKSLRAFLMAKVLKDHHPLLPYVIDPQYFFTPSFYKLDDDAVLLDGGAFDGDSALNFINFTGGKYGKIIACEPDPLNFENLKKNLGERGVKNLIALNVGLGEEKSSLKFNSNFGMVSTFSGTGDIEVPVDTIDNIVATATGGGSSISVIKFDIEKFEMPALRGAVNTVKKDRPVLAISAYHKRDDVFNIYRYVTGTADNYKFYFRCHKATPNDAVLYAVPAERVNNER